ncbi:MAG: hypothetical protein ACREMR_10740 [Gemmatimonadales bacterium]
MAARQKSNVPVSPPTVMSVPSAAPPPGDPHRQLAAEQRAVAAQRPDPHDHALRDQHVVAADRAVHGLAAGAGARDEVPGSGIDIRRRRRILEHHQGGEEQHRVSLT